MAPGACAPYKSCVTWRLSITEPGAVTRSEPLAEGAPTVVGRSPGAQEPGLVLADPFASKRHATLRPVGEAVEVLDLGSSNGVLLNGHRIQASALARVGDVVQVGRTRLLLERDGPRSPGLEAALPAALADRYVVEQALSENETASVYRVTEGPRGRRLALKVVRSADATAATHLQREIRLLRRLAHPHLVAIVDGGEVDGCVWLATDWVVGGSLEERVRTAGPLSEAEARAVADQLLDALGIAHALGVVHRDLKPANVFVDSARAWPFVVLGDFGLAAPASTDTPSRLTTTGSMKGTPRYMAPEQLRDAKRAGPAADQFGLAATLYHALTGAWHLTESGRGAWLDLLDSKVVPLRERRDDLSAGFSSWLERALAREVSARYPSVAAMRRALAELGTA